MNSLGIVVGLSALVVMVVGAAAYGLFLVFNPTRTAQDRLREMAESGDGAGLGAVTTDPGMDGVAGRLGRLAAPGSEDDKNKLKQQLLQAGYKHRHAADIFNGVRVTASMSLPLFVLPFATGMSITSLAATSLIAASAGYYGPGILINNVVAKRKADLLASLPDCMDLLVSSVEAGLGIDAAFRRVAAEMEATAPDLSREFQLVNHEISAGVSRVDALRHLEQRTGLDEVRSLVNMLAQSERFGTSIAKSLRIHAKGSRHKRMMKAEEEAAKVSPKLTVVMILFLLPVLMSVLLGPAAINVMNMMGGP